MKRGGDLLSSLGLFGEADMSAFNIPWILSEPARLPLSRKKTIDIHLAFNEKYTLKYMTFIMDPSTPKCICSNLTGEDR